MGKRPGAARGAWTDLGRGAYLQLLSLEGFSLPVCEMGTELYALFMHSPSIYCAVSWRLLSQRQKHRLPVSTLDSVHQAHYK